MEYGEILGNSNQKVDRLISGAFRKISCIMLLLLLLSFNDTLELHLTHIQIDLALASVILLLPTIAVHIWKELKGKIRYIIIDCSILICLLAMCHFMDYTCLLAAIPVTLASLYFDKKLEIYTTVTTGLAIILASLSHKIGLIRLITGQGVFTDLVRGEIIIRLVEYGLFAIAILYLSDRCIKIVEQAVYDSKELKRNRDGLDVIVDYTDALFCAKSYEGIATLILFIIRSLLASLQDAPEIIEGYAAVKESKDTFWGINEEMETMQYQVKNQEIIVKVNEEEYIIPVIETKESNTVFVNKDKLTMFFYSDGALVAFVILHIHLAQTEEVLNKLIRVLYRNVRLAINNIKLSRDMYETQEELVRAFSEISESKSGQTGKHIKRVSEYMKIMAEALELEQEEKESLVIASMMHDIGKLMIPEHILEKPGRLTTEEFEVIKKHVQWGYKLLEYAPGRVMEIARVIALQHHEKWDGTGYLGMRGEEIDYYSRVMAVVDVFDALMSKRSYKASWSIEEAYNEIVSQSGKHFDPQVVELFKAHFNEFVEVLNHYPDCEKIA